MCILSTHTHHVYFVDVEPPSFSPNADVESTTTGFRLNWTEPDPDSGITSWKVYYKEKGSDEWSFVEIDDPSQASVVVSPEGAGPGDTYDVQIVPVSGSTENRDSELLEVTLSKYQHNF